MRTEPIPTQTILNPTGGFLGGGFTHTMNLYRGCALGNSLCGLYCYAQWNPHHTLGRRWGSFLDIKMDYVEAYQAEYDRLKRPSRGEPKPLRIFLSSVTEPYPPQERTARRMRRLLEEMVIRPPDRLVIQSHTPLVLDDLSVLQQLRTAAPDNDLFALTLSTHPPAQQRLEYLELAMGQRLDRFSGKPSVSIAQRVRGR